MRPWALSLAHTMLVIMLVVLRMVMQEELATFVQASEGYASEPAWSMLLYARKLKNFNFFGASDAERVCTS